MTGASLGAPEPTPRWVLREPVRVRLYSLIGPAVALAAGYALVSDERALLWGAVAGAVLGPVAVESARAKVTPTADP